MMYSIEVTDAIEALARVIDVEHRTLPERHDGYRAVCQTVLQLCGELRNPAAVLIFTKDSIRHYADLEEEVFTTSFTGFDIAADITDSCIGIEDLLGPLGD